MSARVQSGPAAFGPAGTRGGRGREPEETTAAVLTARTKLLGQAIRSMQSKTCGQMPPPDAGSAKEKARGRGPGLVRSRRLGNYAPFLNFAASSIRPSRSRRCRNARRRRRACPCRRSDTHCGSAGPRNSIRGFRACPRRSALARKAMCRRYAASCHGAAWCATG